MKWLENRKALGSYIVYCKWSQITSQCGSSVLNTDWLEKNSFSRLLSSLCSPIDSFWPAYHIVGMESLWWLPHHAAEMDSSRLPHCTAAMDSSRLPCHTAEMDSPRLPHSTAEMDYNPVLLPAGMDSSRPALLTLGICKLIRTLPLENGSNATANFHLNWLRPLSNNCQNVCVWLHL